MKFGSLYLLLFSVLLLFSCSDDEFVDINDIVNGTIDTGIDLDGTAEGLWVLTTFALQNPIDLNEDGVSDPNLITETSCHTSDRFVLESDGSGSFLANNFLEITYSINDDGETVFDWDCTAEDINNTVSWTEEETLVTVVVDGQTLLFTRSGDQMVVTLPDLFIITPEDPADDAIIQDMTLTYTRQ